MTAPRALALYGDESGCTMWRVIQPFNALRRHGMVADWAPINGCPACGNRRPEELRAPGVWWACSRCGFCHTADDSTQLVLPDMAAGRWDVLVVPRIAWPADGRGAAWMKEVHKCGMAIVMEVDDDYFSPGIVQRQYNLFQTERAKGLERLEQERLEKIRLLSMVDGVTVTTPRLKSIIGRYAPDDLPVAIVPNAIDAAEFRTTLRGCGRIPELEGKLTIGWAGGSREDADFAPIVEAWGILARRYPDVHFVVQGHISGALADAVPKEQRHTLPWLPLPEYPRGLLNIDIGCCSVAPTVFNTAKSCIKWYEMTLAGAACVVSKTLYGREVTDGENAMVAETAEQWVFALSWLVEHPEYRRMIQRNARHTVMTEHSLEANWQNWPIAWAEMLEQFHEKRSRQLVLAS